MLSALTLLAACSTTAEVDRVEPSFVYVELLQQEVGTPERPLPFSSAEQDIPVRVTTLDINGDPYPFEGDLTVDMRPGDVLQDPKVTITGGVYEGAVTVANGFGPTRIWFSDLGDKDIDSTRPKSFATGVSDPMHIRQPTLAEMNLHEDHETNNLDGEFAEIRVDDRDARVSAVGANGFWVMDLSDKIGGHNGLFVYTFSKPDDDVELGRKITLLNGNNQEYLATTQLSFPSVEVSDAPATAMPEPALLDWTWCDDSEILEGYESTPVRLEAGQIPTTFIEGDEDYLDYLEFGQWPLVEQGVGGCTFYADTSGAIPTFYPTDHTGESVPYVEGMLAEIWGQWILVARDTTDIPPSFLPTDTRAGTPRRPLPRHRPALR